MAYSAEVVKRARARLAQAKEDRESENRQHLAVAYARVPRIQEIDIQLRRTMAQAAQAAFLQGNDGRELLEKARLENLELQQERAILAMENFEEGYLDDSPICDKCGGSGYIGSNMCECLTELCRQEQKKELSSLLGGKEHFDQFRLDYYPAEPDPQTGVSPRMLMQNTYQLCLRYAKEFSRKSPSLLFTGGPGLGKTFLSACIARTVADSGYSVVYDTAGKLFADFEAVKFGGDRADLTQKYLKCDLLIIDDLGTEMTTQFTQSVLYQVINTRLMDGAPVIVSTNLTTEALSRRYPGPIASRLLGAYQLCPFLGRDIRQLRR